MCGPALPTGGYLMRSGEVESKIGRSMDKFRDRVKDEFVIPLRTFLNVDIKNALVSCFVLSGCVHPPTLHSCLSSLLGPDRRRRN